MKSTTIPAQITSVEDRIAGALSLTQLMLMLCCLFLCVAVYAILPEANSLGGYKIPLVFFITSLFLASAVRFKDKLLLQWFLVILAFIARPKIFVFNKNTSTARKADVTSQEVDDSLKTNKSHSEIDPVQIDKRFIEEYLADPRISMNIAFCKGGLRVKATRIEG